MTGARILHVRAFRLSTTMATNDRDSTEDVGETVCPTNSRLYSWKEQSRGWSGLAIEDCHYQNGTEEAEPMAAA
jgi:hypothetical protein